MLKRRGSNCPAPHRNADERQGSKHVVDRGRRGLRRSRLVCGLPLDDDAQEAALAGASSTALVHLRFGTQRRSGAAPDGWPPHKTRTTAARTPRAPRRTATRADPPTRFRDGGGKSHGIQGRCPHKGRRGSQRSARAERHGQRSDHTALERGHPGHRPVRRVSPARAVI